MVDINIVMNNMVINQAARFGKDKDIDQTHRRRISSWLNRIEGPFRLSVLVSASLYRVSANPLLPSLSYC